MKPRNRRLGFTLLELMIAIAIIGILAAIALPRLVAARYRAYFASCMQNERNIATALESYRTDYRVYPPNLNALVQINMAGHIASIPTCQSAPGTSYGYERDTLGESFTVSCSDGYHVFQVSGQQAGYPQYSASQGIIENGP